MVTTGSGANDGFPRPLTPDDTFYRVIHPDWLKKRNGTISSGAFSKSKKDNRMSMDWSEKSTIQESYGRMEKWGDCRGLASLTAKLCWDNCQTIFFDPIENDPVLDDNPAHSQMANATEPPQMSDKRLRRQLARGAKLLVDYNQVPPLSDSAK